MEIALDDADPHRSCKPGRCAFPGFAESGGGKYVYLPSGKEVYFAGCPATHVSDDVRQWLDAYRWLKLGKTPMDLGWLTLDELDPRYFEAMTVIDSEVNRLQDEAVKRKKG